MNASAFRDIWTRVMFFKVSKLQFENLKNIMNDHISRNARAIIRFFIYNILNKIVKKNQENAIVTVLWTRNSEMASKLLTCFSLTNQLQPCDK